MNLIQTIMQNKNLMNLCMKALGAMARGESPTDFLKNVAMTNPALQGYDFDNLEETAQDICKQRNVDMDNMKSQIEDFAKSHINH